MVQDQLWVVQICRAPDGVADMRDDRLSRKAEQEDSREGERSQKLCSLMRHSLACNYAILDSPTPVTRQHRALLSRQCSSEDSVTRLQRNLMTLGQATAFAGKSDNAGHDLVELKILRGVNRSDAIIL